MPAVAFELCLVFGLGLGSFQSQVPREDLTQKRTQHCAVADRVEGVEDVAGQVRVVLPVCLNLRCVVGLVVLGVHSTGARARIDAIVDHTVDDLDVG